MCGAIDQRDESRNKRRAQRAREIFDDGATFVIAIVQLREGDTIEIFEGAQA